LNLAIIGQGVFFSIKFRTFGTRIPAGGLTRVPIRVPTRVFIKEMLQKFIPIFDCIKFHEIKKFFNYCVIKSLFMTIFKGFGSNIIVSIYVIFYLL